jgi:hypothetical protein
MVSLLVVAGLCIWGATCQLDESEVVSRMPDLGHGTGGSSGQDMAVDEADIPDAGSGDGLGLDSPSTMSDTPGIVMDSGTSTVGVDASCEVNRDAISADASIVNDVHDASIAGSNQFFENFEDGAKLWVSAEGNWAISNNHGDAEANAVFGPTEQEPSIAYLLSGAWQDMTVEAKVMLTSFDPSSSSSRAVLCARYQDLSHSYGVTLRGDGKLGLRRNTTAFGTVASVSVGENEWHSLKIRVSGPVDKVVVEGFLDGTLLTTATDTTGSMTSNVGTIAVGVYGGALAVFDDVSVSSP